MNFLSICFSCKYSLFSLLLSISDANSSGLWQEKAVVVKPKRKNRSARVKPSVKVEKAVLAVLEP